MKLIRDMTFSELILYCMTARKYEPYVRVKDTERRGRGDRNAQVAARHHGHVYQIRGGITARALLVQNLTKDNALFKKLSEKSPR